MNKGVRIFFTIGACLLAAFHASAENLPYEVTINTPTAESRQILHDNLDLLTQRTLDDLTQDQIDVLEEDTPDQAKKFLQTLGYFNSQVTVEKQGKNFVIHVTLGEPVKVANAQILLDGPILQDEEFPDRYRTLMENWALPIGNVFTQNDWSYSKEKTLRSITAEYYPLAKITQSKAEIDTDKNTAVLTLAIDSDKFVRFGDITIQGAKRYPETVAKNLAEFDKGTPDTLNKMLEYQSALEQDNHYSNASVGPRFDQMKPEDDMLPLTVKVEEVPLKKLDAGLKYDTAEGVGVNGSFSHYNVFNKGYTGSVAGKFGNYDQSASVGLASPRSANGYIYMAHTGFQNTELQKLRTKTINGSIWQLRQRGDIEARFGLEYMREDSKITDNGEDFGTSQALMVRFGWLQRKLDSHNHPKNGYLADISFGITPGSLASSTFFTRTNIRGAYYYTPKETKIGTFLLHGELGHIWAKNDKEVPKTLLFRTGGASTVRGYEYQGIGIDLPNDAIIGGTSMALFSLEYQYPITDSVALALFHDEGSVSNKFSKLNFESSNGFGVRWFSPVAPLSIDVAHADKDKKWRWHLSLGLLF